ncbi:Hypothetical protein R9X50_00553200 [Acrodontium crateriforme]|uniref:DNA mismatch repair protein S5 domain-containing protein n=1 Tax=Acrodontium crateriforme TaxID=150365 RepID=A0AAQ3M9T9_9PEZI|nr:Hypothetical protein R9X50_00553200 [Acrodontium crateriforme]
MTIQKLATATVRSIGASQTLTDLASVVKELLDNALDAQATSVTIEIASNTLDTLQVRDNGHGIPPEDRAMVALPHCTSKLISEDDLKTIGGSSLGFRGEALASMAEMSGSLTIATRVNGEQVATLLKINKNGEVSGQEHASLPIGTTIKIIDFIKANPVRRQVALKNSEKCLKNIKQILHAYAFARPHVRLCLKVVKAKSDKFNWMYAPSPNGVIEDAALRVVGSACTSQCNFYRTEDSGMSLAALLPRFDAESSKISGFGSFISIDSRPVTASRGTLNQIIKIYRRALQNANPRCEGIKEPFIYLAVTFDSAAYDPNIEPAKDDVLFEDADAVMAGVNKLFATAYPVREKTPPGEPEVVQPTPITPKTRFGANMYDVEEDELELYSGASLTNQCDQYFQDLTQAHNDITVSNPWVITKMNIPSRRPAEDYGLSPLPTKEGHPRISTNSPTRPRNVLNGNVSHLATPSQSSPMKGFHPSDHVPTMRLARDGRLIGEQTLPQPQIYAHSPLSLNSSGAHTPSAGVQHQSLGNNHEASSQSDDLNGTPLHAIPAATMRPRNRPQRRGTVNKPYVNPTRSQSDREKVWFDHLEKRNSSSTKTQYPRRHHDSSSLVTQGDPDDIAQPMPITPPRRNRDIRDFIGSADLADKEPRSSKDLVVEEPIGSIIEARQCPQRNMATARPEASPDQTSFRLGKVMGPRCDFVPVSELADFTSPTGQVSDDPLQKRRRTKSGRPLEEISANVMPQDDEDYHPEIVEAPSKTRRKSSSKLTRTRSSRLPLERTPAGKVTHNVIGLFPNAPTDAFENPMIGENNFVLGWKELSIYSYHAFDPSPEGPELKTITSRLHSLLVSKVSDGEMVQDLGEILRKALTEAVGTDDHCDDDTESMIMF